MLKTILQSAILPLAFLVWSTPSSAQQIMQFTASSGSYCSYSGTQIFGAQADPLGWLLEGPHLSLSVPHAFEQYSWTLSDEEGTLATGSFDSRTGSSTGGSGVDRSSFETP